MKQIHKNQRGIAILTELLLVGLVLSAGSAVAVRSYYANRAPNIETAGASPHKDKPDAKTTNSTSATAKKTTPPPAADPYAGWKSCTTPTEKLSIRFPSDWTGQCVKLSPSDGGVDQISVGKDGYGITITIYRNDELRGDNDTVYNTTGAPADNYTSIHESFSLNGRSVYFLTNSDTGDRHSLLLSATDGAHLSFVPNKNVPGRFRAAFGYTQGPATLPGHVVSGFALDDPVVAVGKQILKSLHY